MLSIFLFLYFATPAASSKMPRRSMGLASANVMTFPWEMMLRLDLPSPVSRNRSTTSLSLTLFRLIRYSASPLSRYRRRVTSSSSFSVFRIWALLSKTSVTSAIFRGLRSADPEKMTSLIFSPRICRLLCSPSTQRTASVIFDFPHPFGPTIPVIGCSKEITVLSAKDLNPCISIRFKNIAHSLKVRAYYIKKGALHGEVLQAFLI